jgi:pantoate--beta-alanine ligase
LVNARTAALNHSNSASEHIKKQIVQTLTEAGGQVDYVEVIFEPFLIHSRVDVLLEAIYFVLCCNI